MSTRAMRCFALPTEVVALLAEQSERLGLIATVYEAPLMSSRVGRAGHLLDLNIDWARHGPGQMRIMLHRPDAGASVSWGSLNTARLGWVDVSLGRCRPEADDRYLELSAIGSKSDYLDNGTLMENHESHQIFQRLTRPLKARLHHPMLVRNVVSGSERVHGDMYYSDGAAAFEASGGELRQWGVKNIRFYPLRSSGVAKSSSQS